MFTESDIQSDLLLKVLLESPPKAGKTVCAIGTTPKPVFVLNADPGGLISAKRHGLKFKGVNIIDERGASHYAALVKGMKELRAELQSKTPPATVVIDTASMFALYLEAELKKKYGSDKRALYAEFKDIMIGWTMEVLSMPVHVIINAHTIDTGNEAGSMGTIPLISGQAKTIIPGLCNDILWLELTPKNRENPAEKREFLLGPQGSWKHGCRSLKFNGTMPADFNLFIKRIKDEQTSNERKVANAQ